MARSQSHRKYQLTINNPIDHHLDHDVLRTTLQSFSGCLYWCMCDEVGEQGTYHTHIYVAFKNAVEFTTMQERFYGAHFEAAKGSHQQNRDYIRKEGKWKDDAKHETNLPDTFEESGELPPETDRRQKQAEAIVQLIRDGASNVEIIDEFPSAMTRLNHIEQTRQTILHEHHRREWRNLEVTYLWGSTGVGKTRRVMEYYGYENVYRVTNYTHPFDNYRGEDVIVFDEFRSSLPIVDMLVYLDGYPVSLPCRYADKIACFTKVYIISNIPIEEQFKATQYNEMETYQAFLRRIHNNEEMI